MTGSGGFDVCGGSGEHLPLLVTLSYQMQDKEATTSHRQFWRLWRFRS